MDVQLPPAHLAQGGLTAQGQVEARDGGLAGAGRDRQGVGAWLTTARQWMLLKSVYSIREAGRGFLETLQAMSCGSLKPNHLHLVQYAPVYLGNFH